MISPYIESPLSKVIDFTVFEPLLSAIHKTLGYSNFTFSPNSIESSAMHWILPVKPFSILITGAIKTGLCFYNEYDERGRIIIKSSPDGGEVWMVYDNRDRLILSQDANQRNRLNQVPSKPNQWSFSLYDELDRAIVTGLWEDSRDRAAMVIMAKSLNQQNVNVNFYTGNPALEQLPVYNPVVAGSSSSIVITSVNYYDEYKHIKL